MTTELNEEIKIVEYFPDWKKFRKIGREVEINMTTSQYNAFGKIINNLYYSTRMLDLIQSSGYPHNGGSHTLYIRGTIADLNAFLDLMIEKYCGITSRFEGKDILPLIKTRLNQL